MMEKALVLCGGMSQLRLIKELQKKGITALLADMNDKAPAVEYADKFFNVSTLDVDGIRKIAMEEKVDCILSVCADQMLLVAAQISEELGLPCYIDFDTAKKVSSKEYMKRIFAENNIPTSKYIVRETLQEADLEGLQWPLIVKPVDCYSSKGVKKVTTLDELFEAFERAVSYSRTNTAIVEEYVGGEELSVDYYIENGEAKILCCRILDKIPEGNGFIICRGKYPAEISVQTKEEVRKVGQKIAEAFGLQNTPMLVQMKLDNGNIKVIEFCARTGGGIKYRLLPHITGFDVVNSILDLTMGIKPHYDGSIKDLYIIDEFLYCRPGIFDHLEGFDQLLNDGIITHFDQFKAKGTVFGDIESSGNRVAYFSIEASSKAELKRKYDLAAKTVKAMSIDGEDLIRHDFINCRI